MQFIIPFFRQASPHNRGKNVERPSEAINSGPLGNPRRASDETSDKSTDDTSRERHDAGNPSRSDASSNLAGPGSSEGSGIAGGSGGPGNSTNSSSRNSEPRNSEPRNSIPRTVIRSNLPPGSLSGTGISRGSASRGNPGNLANRPVILRNPTTPNTPEPVTRLSLWSVAPLVGSLILLASVCSSTLLGLFFVLYEAPSCASIGVLSVFFYLAHTAFLAVFTFHPCIRPEPEGPGRTVFFYFFSWFAVQTVGFACVDFLWDRAWPDYMKRLCVAWMLLSLASVGLWTFALIFIIGRRGRGRNGSKWSGRRAGGWDIELARGYGPRAPARLRQQTPPPWSPPIERRGPPPAYTPSGSGIAEPRG